MVACTRKKRGARVLVMLSSCLREYERDPRPDNRSFTPDLATCLQKVKQNSQQIKKTAERKMKALPGPGFPLCPLTLSSCHQTQSIPSLRPPPPPPRPPSLIGSERRGRRFPPNNKGNFFSSSFSPLGCHQGRRRSLKAPESHPVRMIFFTVFRLQR